MKSTSGNDTYLNVDAEDQLNEFNNPITNMYQFWVDNNERYVMYYNNGLYYSRENQLLSL